MTTTMTKIMKTVRVLLALLMVSSCPIVPAHAEMYGANFTYRYDIDSTTMTYCKVVGANDQPWNKGSWQLVGLAPIKTTGSSVTVNAVTAGRNPFDPVSAKDIIIVARGGATAPDLRVVQSKASADQITVQTAVNWDTTAGFSFKYLRTVCGTTDADGWIDMQTVGPGPKNVTFLLEQISGVTGGIDMHIQCRGSALGDLPNTVHPGAAGSCSPGTSAGGFCNFTAAGLTTGRLAVAIPDSIVCPLLRVGIKINTSETAETVEADNERITITVNAEQSK